MATGTAGPLTSYPQPCLRPQHFPLLRPGCHSELGRVPSGDHSAPAAPGHCGGAPTTPQHSQLCSQLGPATWAPVSPRLGPLGCRTRSLCGRWSFQRLPPPAARVGRLLARWLPWVPGKLVVTAMSSWEHGHQVAGERITRGARCGQSVVIELSWAFGDPCQGPRPHVCIWSCPVPLGVSRSDEVGCVASPPRFGKTSRAVDSGQPSFYLILF